VELLVSFGAAAALVFVAELGDKSQLLSLWFATRYGLWTVLAGVATATVVVMGVAVVVGAIFGAVLPRTLFLTVAGLLFFVFAAWSLRHEQEEDEEEEVRAAPAFGAYGIVTVSIVVSEMGDKTQLATVALAGDRDPVGVWLGATAGMFTAVAIAVFIGKVAGKRLPHRLISIGAAVLFAAFGVATLWEAWS
jgi:Ca2+/H+ antiporter, TMEM165/GDT1 family